MKTIQAIRGMHDLLPKDSSLWHYVEACIIDVLNSYGYREIRFPVLEQTELFKRSIGEITDIVEKEMYTFEDRNGDWLTLRPEGTACCVRACQEHSLLHNATQRLWYMGPMFRHERPQKGRLRQFHQFGIEAFGMEGPDIDVEIILLSARLWRLLGIDDVLTLEVNTLASSEARAKYREALVDYLSQYESDLDEDSRRRLTSNPLRILDSKNPTTQDLLNDAPKMAAFIDEESQQHYEKLLELLAKADLGFVQNPKLVRGLDYYNRTVFEWTTDKLGAQGTVCAGGRYDGLVELLGGKPTPAVGSALGMERLILLLETLALVPDCIRHHVDVFFSVVGEKAQSEALLLAEHLHDEVPHLHMYLHCGGGSLKSQMKKADKSGASLALILGEEELENKQISVKFLREESGHPGQLQVPMDELSQFLQQHL